MKKITLTLLALLTYTLNYGQTVIWSDDFNDEDISDWTLIDSDGDGFTWGDTFVITDGTNPTTPVSLISRSWQEYPLFPDNWAITPAIDLSGVSGTIMLDYVTQVAGASWDAEKYSVHVGTVNDITQLLNSDTSLTEILGDAAHSGAPTPKSLDISSFAGEAEVYIAFRHWDVTDMDYISIDDVTVSTTMSVGEYELSSFAHYYNKTSMMLDLKSSTSEISNIEIYSVLGKRILSQSLNNTTESIDVSTLVDGVYLAKVNIGGNTKTIKFIKS